MNKFARFGFGASLATLGGASMAAVPEGVTTAITGMATDGAVVAGAVFVAILAIAAIKFLRKAL